MIQKRNQYKPWVWLTLLALLGVGCRKPYEPAVFSTGANYLVVDGFVNIAPGGTTTIRLSRTADINDSVVSRPEANATINIESSTGQSYALQQQGNGVYNSAALVLNTFSQYRLYIKTPAGEEYRSDFAAGRPTPPIDSITWKQDNDVTIYANTHDPAENTHYYRWTYTETWQYQSLIEAELGVANGLIYYLDPITQQQHTCWRTDSSTTVVTGTSIALSHDVISAAPLTTLLHNDGKLDIRYSILVSQYALTADAYNYWQIIQRNSQQVGGLFDAQPSELMGNIHSLSNPNEPVVGYITATNLQQSRLFINNSDLQGVWKSTPPDFGCSELTIPQNATNYLIFDYPNKAYVPVYFITAGSQLAIAQAACVNCTLQGGVNQKPAFW